MDASKLINANQAISTMVAAGLLSKRVAATARQELLAKINACIAYWADKEQWDIVEGLNTAYREMSV